MATGSSNNHEDNEEGTKKVRPPQKKQTPSGPLDSVPTARVTKPFRNITEKDGSAITSKQPREAPSDVGHTTEKGMPVTSGPRRTAKDFNSTTNVQKPAADKAVQRITAKDFNSTTDVHGTTGDKTSGPIKVDDKLMSASFRLLSRFGGVINAAHVLIRPDANARPVATVTAVGGKILEAATIGSALDVVGLLEAMFKDRVPADLRGRVEFRRADKLCFKTIRDQNILNQSELSRFMLHCLAKIFVQVIKLGQVEKAVLERVPIDDDLSQYPVANPLDIMILIIEQLKAEGQ